MEILVFPSLSDADVCPPRRDVVVAGPSSRLPTGFVARRFGACDRVGQIDFGRVTHLSEITTIQISLELRREVVARGCGMDTIVDDLDRTDVPGNITKTPSPLC